jgi:cyclohexa-1,5-dienecarbonyl-CoA hydratase
MPYENIHVSNSEGITTITLKHPPVNVITIAMMEEIRHALSEIAPANTRVLVLRGAGKCFSAGMDVGEHLPGQFKRMFQAMHELFDQLFSLSIPTLSAVHGMALGGGMELALTTDITYAASGCKFGQPEIKLAVFPPVAAAYYPHLCGSKIAAELVLTGRSFTAEEALTAGLINSVWSDNEFESKLEEAAKTLASYSTPALKAAKRALRIAGGIPFSEALAAAEKIYADEVMTTADAAEGLNSFLEKRSPQWKHR